MAENKYTQKMFYEEVIAAMSDNANAVAMAQKKLEQLANKSGKVSAKRVEEQENFLDLIRDVLAECADVRGAKCGAIAKDSRIAEFQWADGNATSPNRVNAYLKKLVDLGDVVKVTDKKEVFFHLA